jgi:hypothetical protein
LTNNSSVHFVEELPHTPTSVGADAPFLTPIVELDRKPSAFSDTTTHVGDDSKVKVKPLNGAEVDTPKAAPAKAELNDEMDVDVTPFKEQPKVLAHLVDPKSLDDLEKVRID